MIDLSPGVALYLARRRGLSLDGKEVTDREALPCFDPATGEEIGEVALATPGDVDCAARAAHQAFQDKRWRGKTPAERQRILLRVADLIERDAALLAGLETLNGGKLYGAALHGEVPHCAETFRYYAGWVTKLGGSTFEPSVPGARYHAFVREDAIGVAGLITPWNGALVAASWKLAPALAAGCSC
ncbi:MAG: aldehyde dehydrogenase family protein, partial [Pseudomonadota bacterium]